MILALSVRFKKHIALSLFGVFYLQLIFAGPAPVFSGWEKNTRGYTYLFKPGSGFLRPGIFYPFARPVSGMRPPSLSGTRLLSASGERANDEVEKPVTGKAGNPAEEAYGEAYEAGVAGAVKGSPDKTSVGGPTQPEMQSFQSVNANNMVDLFSGDFSYNIPLLDVGGYPVNISYHSGVTMDEDASWVGLGWNVNPGSITRNMRGLPDDFNGGADTVKKVMNTKQNLTIGVNGMYGMELNGLPVKLSVGAGIFHSTYSGWGAEALLNVSLNAGEKAAGPLSGGLNITSNSQTGLTLSPNLAVNLEKKGAETNGGFGGGINLSLPYNSRTGIKALQLGLSDKQYKLMNGVMKQGGSQWSTSISFASPTYNPSMSLPLTNYNYSFTAKLGGEITVDHPNGSITGYVSNQYVAAADTSLLIPAYGYLNYQNAAGNWAAQMDYNREKEMAYREKPAIPHIAVPSYTYDVFSISGEGTGGMFRAYRGDVGFIYDHLRRSKTTSGAASIDFGAGNLVHGGTDLNANYSVVQTGPWLDENPLSKTLAFRQNQGLFEASYFRNPGEKTINTTAFYDSIGGDNVVAATLYQPGNSGSSILTTNNLTEYSGKKEVGSVNLSPSSVVKNTRDKRSQVISYLTASEASQNGLSKYIEHYAVNQFGLRYCENDAPEDLAGNGTGLYGYYYDNKYLNGSPRHIRQDTAVHFHLDNHNPFASTDKSFPGELYSVRWLGRLKAPVSGTYRFGTYSDDGIRVWINDVKVIDRWSVHSYTWDTCTLNLVGGQFYKIRVDYYQERGHSVTYLDWLPPGGTIEGGNDHNPTQGPIPGKYLYPPIFTDTAVVNPIMTRENRVNDFRKSSHISEIDVLNGDGRRYVYGIPVYNLGQKEASFSVDSKKGNMQTGLAAYSSQDNSTSNNEGKDGYYSRDEVPAYAHSFLLTGILSTDYVDVTGDGISDDDLGDAVKFDYSKTSGVANPFQWRAPYIQDSVNYNEGLRTYDRDDKGHYIYGTKELWYLHSIESKTMVANFTMQSRADLLEIDEGGHKKNNSKAMCLKQIDLYSKADFMQHGTAATPIKTVHFEYSYELCRGINQPVNDSGKLTLKRIWFTYNGNDKGVKNPYVFHYHNNNPRFAANAADKWGLYKNLYQNPGSSPSHPINNAEYPYALQDSAAAAYNAGAWMLDSIKLPSGGRIKVNYESDDYGFVQNRRATQMFKIAGFGLGSSGPYSNHLFLRSTDNLYVYVRVPRKPASDRDLYARYLEGIGKMYFKLYDIMPTDDFGSGSEYVPGYAEADTTALRWYGSLNDSTIWIKVRGVNSTGDGDGPFSPMSETALNFLRLNLPSKAYPTSELPENLNFIDAIKIILSVIGNVTSMFSSFEHTARNNGWASAVDTSRSYIRLNCPTLKKIGGGLRVKSVLIYDNWNAMTGKKESLYGQVYDYTTTRSVNGVNTSISSGVASWEPVVGGEENPFHLPIEYVDRTSVLGPSTSLYTEEPLGESFFPGASVGYSRVRVSSVHKDKTRSANGHAETRFYTSYDFPSSWDWSMIDNNTKKRYKPLLSNFLRINTKNYLSISQGFKVELNDMNGKMRSEASYAETDTTGPVSYTENFYRVDNPSVEYKHLQNTVATIDASGHIDTASTIGKDVELMADMREETTTAIGGNVNVDVDVFVAGVWPVAIPALLGLYQQETDRFRSVGMTKVIQRYGILDSVIHIDKGSRISSKNILYDSETGDPLLVRTQNEFNDSLYQFTYPAHWVYRGTGPAYANIDATLTGLTVSHGKITAGLPGADSLYLTAGDELIVYSKLTISDSGCHKIKYSSFADPYKLWVIDTNTVSGGPQRLFLVNQYGLPFSGNEITLKVTRSGYRNLGGAMGSLTSLGNPIGKDGSGNYRLIVDSTTRVLSAGASELKQYWKVADKKRSNTIESCAISSTDSAAFATQGCSCLKPFFGYLIASKNLFIPKTYHRSVGDIVDSANAHGFPITIASCSVLNANKDLPFYALSASAESPIYQARIGNDVVDLRSVSGQPVSLYNLTQSLCDSAGTVHFKDTALKASAPDTVHVKWFPNFSANLISSLGTSCPAYLDTLGSVDSVSDHLLVENSLSIGGTERNAISILRFDKISQRIPAGATILSARMVLQADLRGHDSAWTNANSVNPSDSVGYSISQPPGWFPFQYLDTMLYQAYYSPWFKGVKNSSAFQNDTVDVSDWLSGYLSGAYASNTFILTQGSGGLNNPVRGVDSQTVALGAVPRYLLSGYGNYYSTFYSQRYSDTAKWPGIELVYINPPPAVDTSGAVLEFNSTLACTTITGRTCYSGVTDTIVNPYQYGILGNFRPDRNYVYYGSRKETDPVNQITNIRTNGTISGFLPFWTLSGGRWAPSYDTSRWVWNSQTNLYNRKGFELENNDPLGRYNSGLYGYGLTLPTAVTQNSHYQESYFDGFEDYGYTDNSCDTSCSDKRPFETNPSEGTSISTAAAHSGLYSLRLEKAHSITLSAVVQAAPDQSIPRLSDSLHTDSCSATGYSLGGIKASANTILPAFSPIAGTKVLIGVWVKEETPCTCKQYALDSLTVSFSRTSGDLTLPFFKPSGNMIEGWQRYEAIVDIPANATAMLVKLQASDTSATYFDDIRIHPFNAEMKSYVYNPVNLRLMAELDENNYATFYEYDDDGTLIRVKKETERGIQTIKETRSALLKE